MGTLNNPLNDADPNVDGIGRERLQSYTLLDGLRNAGGSAPWSLGLVNKGELATMGLWSGSGDGALGASPAFLELGADGPTPNNLPLDLRQAASGFEASDDAEERLAIFRAISNIVSTRSDIFTAWYILRAYDPKDIEAITIPAGLSDERAIVDLMNPNSPHALNSDTHPGLLPAWERRILVIFDRSNVRRPTDRPKVLLLVELPRDIPLGADN